jgi:hypothetical protein
MTLSLAAASMNPSVAPTTFNVKTAHAKNETASQAINIGNLQQESSIISVSDQGAIASGAVSTTFTSQAGDVASLSESFGNFVDQATTQFQLYDSSGNVVADSQGTPAQQAAYSTWVNGTLSLNSDTYTAIATPNNAAGGANVAISTTAQQGTSLAVNSQLTGSDTSEYYNFTLAGGNMKLGFDAGTATPSTRVQVYDATGGLVADSAGNSFQQANYIALTSGNGLDATSGNYSLQVSYAATADTTQPINYNFQLYSGTNFAVTYQTNATAKPADYTASGSVTATTTALAYSRQAYNTIGEKAASAVNIGWLQQDKSSLNVLSQLTSADNADYFSFTLQSGNNLKFGFDTTQTATPANFNVQILDSTGSRVIADSQGTPAQQAAYKSLTTTNGLAAAAGSYLVKIGYAANAQKTSSQYAFNIFSGTTFAAQYKTIASPQTYGNALLSGTLPGSTGNSSGMAAYLTSQNSSGDILSTLSSFV